MFYPGALVLVVLEIIQAELLVMVLILQVLAVIVIVDNSYRSQP